MLPLEDAPRDTFGIPPKVEQQGEWMKSKKRKGKEGKHFKGCC
jgi:hypothetical protein